MTSGFFLAPENSHGLHRYRYRCRTGVGKEEVVPIALSRHNDCDYSRSEIILVLEI